MPTQRDINAALGKYAGIVLPIVSVIKDGAWNGDFADPQSPFMTNEVLGKIICNNLCCVILSQCELGIEAEFWQDGDTSGERPSILPLKRLGPA